MQRILVAYEAAGNFYRISEAKRFEGRKSTYLAVYRQNVGFWTNEKQFEAASHEEAWEKAKSMIPPRKKRDITWMNLYQLYLIQDKDPQE